MLSGVCLGLQLKHFKNLRAYFDCLSKERIKMGDAVPPLQSNELSNVPSHLTLVISTSESRKSEIYGHISTHRSSSCFLVFPGHPLLGSMRPSAIEIQHANFAAFIGFGSGPENSISFPAALEHSTRWYSRHRDRHKYATRIAPFFILLRFEMALCPPRQITPEWAMSLI